MLEMRSRIVGIVNVTPDSFSDGGRDVAATLAHMERLAEEGADVLDIGAESTRPGAKLITPEEEWQRLEPVLCEARKRLPDIQLSVDTRHAETAKRALGEGVDWINDVSVTPDDAMLKVIAHTTCKYVVMHALSVPPSKEHMLPEGVDVAQVMLAWSERTLERLAHAGITGDRVILDPGIGFGKTPDQTWDLLRKLPIIQKHFTLTWLYGHSRKSFFGTVGDGSAAARDMETHMVSAYLAAHNIAYLRVHDVAGTRRAIAVGKHLVSGNI